MPALGSSARALTPGGCAAQVVGEGRCPIVDTWWQTETGAHMITPLPGATTLKPGSATLPFFGVEPAVLNEKGEEMEGECEGWASRPLDPPHSACQCFEIDDVPLTDWALWQRSAAKFAAVYRPCRTNQGHAWCQSALVPHDILVGHTHADEPAAAHKQNKAICRYLVIKTAWPSCMRTLSGDHERFETTYFKVYPGYYFTGDGCRRDADGYYWLIGERALQIRCMTEKPACILHLQYVTDKPDCICLPLVMNLHARQCLVIREQGYGHLQAREVTIRLRQLQLSL